MVFRKVFNKKHTDQVPYYSKGVDVDLEVYLDAALANPGTFHPPIKPRYYLLYI